MSERRKMEAPVPNPETQALWDAAQEGKLVLPKCDSCGRVHWYPRSACPFCGGECTWIAASGKGRIYSYSVMRVAKPPYVIAYVELEEGPKALTNIVDADPDEVAIDQPVTVAFEPTEGGPPVPVFKLAG